MIRSRVIALSVVLLAVVGTLCRSASAENYVWLVSGGFDVPNGRAIHALATDGSSSSVAYAPSALPANSYISNANIDAQGRIIYHVSYGDQEGEFRYGHVFTDEYLFHSNDGDAWGRVVWVPGTDEALYSGRGGGIEAYSPGSTNHRTLTTNYFDEVLSVTPNGTVFFENSLYRNPGDVFTMDLDGGNIQPWSPSGTNNERNACVSPDGLLVAFYQQDFDGLFLATTDGTLINGQANPLVPDVPRRNENHGWVAWSPDSLTVAFVQYGDIWSVNCDGTNLQQLTDGEFGGRWGPCVWGACAAVPAVIDVDIDIKPGSYPNSVNLGSNGVVPVAVLSSAEFDATTIEPDTVILAGAEVAVRGKGNKFLSHHEDVNGDGLTDLLCQVETVNFDPNTFQDGFACLTAETSDGEFIEGWDEIRIVPPE